jgi:uncharacterized cupin superfamily protein
MGKPNSVRYRTSRFRLRYLRQSGLFPLFAVPGKIGNWPNGEVFEAVLSSFNPFRAPMPVPLIETTHCSLNLKPSPIEPSWIIEGNPEACSRPLAISACGTATTLIWSCTAGKFDWYYDLDETIVILEGSIVLESEGMPPERYGVGDVIFFRHGAHAKWHVEEYVKKVAFCRLTNPFWLGFAIRAVNKLKRLRGPRWARQPPQ